MEIDLKLVRARFAAMTLEELLEESALRAEEYTPLARSVLQGEALARGIGPAQIEARRRAGAAVAEESQEHAIDDPALLFSANDKGQMLALATIIRERGVPALVRELDPKAFHCSGHLIGRWGLMAPGARAAEAARILESAVPRHADDDGAGCDGCASCHVEADPAGEQWPEDGDWWKTEPGEGEPEGGRREPPGRGGVQGGSVA